MEKNHDNPELVLALKYVSETNTNVFLTGKAGTGKTTFLKNISKHVGKRKVVVAPTGVAAINAGGVTIHSLFQLPFGPILPETLNQNGYQRKFSKQKLNLIKSLDLLIIDEISMVRADVLDGIDAVLRKYKNANKPFGGIQVLMIGDLHQLSPVANESEWKLLSTHYSSPYFFGSKAFNEANTVTIQLKKIYRQQDQSFIKLLNAVRNNQMTASILSKLNERYKSQEDIDKLQGYITLTAHNTSAQKINREALNKIDEDQVTYTASVSGDFSEGSYPTDFTLALKVGAQVMFVKNDVSIEKQYYNGKIGEVVELREDKVQVKSNDGELIWVEAVSWENRRYALNESTNQVEEKIKGSFTQIPLKLAWAITIHKSQGLTFDKVIIDARASFAHGQVYVALSRCTSLEGIVLKSEIANTSVIMDNSVDVFSQEAEKHHPKEQDLIAAKHRYQSSIIKDVVEATELKRTLFDLKRNHQLFHSVLLGDSYEKLNSITAQMETRIFAVMDKFKPELIRLISEEKLPEDNADLIARLKSAGNYFVKELAVLMDEFAEIHFLTDNSKAEKKMLELHADAISHLEMLMAAFTVFENGFVASDYTDAIGVLGLDKTKSKKKSKSKLSVPVSNSNNSELFEELRAWRTDMASDAGLPAYRIVSTKCLIECSNVLPTTLKNLERINGIGKQKLKQFGDELLQIISDYCKQHDIKDTDLVSLAGKPPKKEKAKAKVDSKIETLALFKQGFDLKEIANERQLTEATIAGHLTSHIADGTISAIKLVNEEILEDLERLFVDDPLIRLSELPQEVIDEHGYQTLRFVKAHVIAMNKTMRL